MMWNKLYFANQMKPSERKFKFHQKTFGNECLIRKEENISCTGDSEAQPQAD